MRRKKENEEYEFDLPGEKQNSIGEMAIYIVVLVALIVVLIVLGVLIWRVSRGLFQSNEEETVEVTQEVAQEIKEESPETEAEDGKEAEADEESGQEEEAEDTETQSGQASVTAGSQVSETEASESQSETTSESSKTTAETSTAGMTFTEVNDTVMAKSATNLRSEPSTESADTVVMVLESGIQVTRTGINSDTGWSRLVYDGQVLYAVSSLLTTDLSGQTTGEAAADPDRVTTLDGRVIIFSSCDDTVTPKMSVNLRTEPSTSQGDATVYYELQYGETVRRTGYDQDAGWSRVEYNGQILYAVTSYLYIVE